MEIENQNQSLSIGFVILIILSLILTGLHGLISIIFLMIISRLNIGRDPKDKHGVSSGASRLGGVAILFSLLSGMMLNMYVTDNLITKIWLLKLIQYCCYQSALGWLG